MHYKLGRELRAGVPPPKKKKKKWFEIEVSHMCRRNAQKVHLHTVSLGNGGGVIRVSLVDPGQAIFFRLYMLPLSFL